MSKVHFARRILGWIVGAFLLPPMMWLLGIWYFGLCTLEQTVSVALTPMLVVYVISYTGGVYILVARHLRRIIACHVAPSPQANHVARQSIGFLPVFFLSAIALYCIIGPNTGLYEKSFVDTPIKYALCWLIGIAIIFVFSVPFFIAMVANLEHLSKGVPIVEPGRSLSISARMLVIFLFTIVGAGVTIAVGCMSVVYMSAGGDVFSALVEKLIGSGIVLVTVAALNMLMMGRQILLPIRRLAAQMEQVAAGNDSVRIEGLELDDEIGEIARAFEGNARRMTWILEEGRSRDASAEKLRRAELGRVADEFRGSVASVVENVARAAEEMLVASGQLGGTAENTTRQASSVAGAAQRTFSSVQTVASATEQLSVSIAEIGGQAEISADIARRAVAQAEDTRRAVSGLSDAAAKIGDVINIIHNIAAQTNLLALNATVEASRAGEAGKGFAVVAAEVKSLANQTEHATREIASQVTAIRDATGETVSAIDGIGAIIRRIDEIASGIKVAVQQQSTATGEISSSIAQAATGTQGISVSIADVSDAARKTATASSKVAVGSAGLSRQSEELKTKVAGFLSALQAA